MSKTADTYDAIVIGTGQGGKPLAMALAGAGRKTAIIERAAVGGTCVNYGCTPTKTMIAHAKVAWWARRSADYGVNTGPVSIDLRKIRQRKRDIVASFRGGSEKRLTSTDNLTLIVGEASFVDPHTIAVRGSNGERQLSAPLIVINTGVSPAVPPIAGLDTVNYLDNASIMELEEVPPQLLVLGGGYIGLEFAQIFRRFGSHVTIVNRSERLLSQEDEDISHAVEQVLRDEGITIIPNANVQQAGKDTAAIRLLLDTPSSTTTIACSHLLVATGRKPNTEVLNLSAAGISTNKHGYVQVNEYLETNVPGVYAMGDVNGGPQFTHVSYNDYLILRENILDGGKGSTAGRPAVYTLYIDPELGRMGLTEHEARAQGLNIQVAKMPMSHVARALETDDTRGLMKAIVDADTKQLLGCAIFGICGGEIMSILQLAMQAGVPYPRLRDAMFAHPTVAESLNNLFASFQN